MIRGVTDTKECARQLIQMLKGFNCHVNLIPLNHVEGSPLVPSTKENLRWFQNELNRNGLNATVRRSLGGDISASCGQLRRQRNEEVSQ
jgi:23S rRNA (adenine2503-C2)-methyltransferase